MGKELFKPVETRKLVITNTKNMMQIVVIVIMLMCAFIYNFGKIKKLEQKIEKIETQIVLMQETK